MAQQDQRSITRGTPAPDVHYTAFVRLPFARGNFIDPPLVDWDTAKDQALWNILSQNSRSAGINWDELAQRFDVTLAFILQQAAWLYERQLSQVREQMRKIGRSQATSPSQGLDTVPSWRPPGLQRPGSRDGPTLALLTMKPSLLTSSTRTASSPTIELGNHPKFKGSESSLKDTLNTKPAITRTASTNTITQSQIMSRSSPRVQTTSRAVNRASQPLFTIADPPRTGHETERSLHNDSPPVSAGSTSESDSSSSESESRKQNLKSQIFRRTPRFANHKRARAKGLNDGSNDDEEDEDGPAFLPYADASHGNQAEMGETLRDPQQPLSREVSNTSEIQSQQSISSAASSASSAIPLSARESNVIPERPSRQPSSAHRAELAGRRSPHGRALGRHGSDGSPSMGSSFSDLDDSSVTQSALEEALLSNMQRGGMGSRISNISQASRSRFS